MKRDMDLIRLLLLDVEGETKVDLSKYDEEQIWGHKKLLIDSGLVKGKLFEEPSPQVRKKSVVVGEDIQGLTWKGHDFLDSARSETVWKKAKMKLASTVGTASFEVIKALLISLAKSEIGLP